jgi:hypothetical protein
VTLPKKHYTARNDVGTHNKPVKLPAGAQAALPAHGPWWSRAGRSLPPSR